MSSTFPSTSKPEATGLKEQFSGLAANWRAKFSHLAAIGLASLGVAAGNFMVEEAQPATAQADTISYSDLGYPNATMPCEHSPYNVSGACANYDWGPLHTEAYDDPSELSSRGYAYRNCTDWVAYRVAALGGTVSHTLGNGGQWYDNALASQRSTTPKDGEAAVVPGNPGHVAFVEAVNSDGTITVSEYNHDAQGHGDIWTGLPSQRGFSEYVDFGVHPTTSPGSSYPDGTFLHTTDTERVYRLVGGAPVRLYNWGVISDFHGQAVDMKQGQIDALPAYPTDGEFVNIQEAGGNGIYEFVGGAPVREFNWGVLKGFDGSKVININYDSLRNLDHMRATPADGEFVNIHEAGGNGIYEFVGGAPIRQFNWGILKGFDGSKLPDINYASLQNLDHMNVVPRNGAFANIHEAGGNGIYEFVGGAPIRQFNWGIIPGFNGATVPDINYASLQNLDHMNPVPADGNFVNLVEAGGNGVYEFIGGAPLRLFNWGAIPGFGNAVNINYASLQNLDHMNAVPANGEFVSPVETGTVYRIAGGAALKLYNQGAIPGFHGALSINQRTIDTTDHLNAVSTDGTVLEGVTSQTYWQINGGKRTPISPRSNAVVVDEQTIKDIPTP